MTQINQLCTQAGYQHTKVHICGLTFPERTEANREPLGHMHKQYYYYTETGATNISIDRCAEVTVTYIPRQSAPGTYQHHCGTHI